jgi:hypothetical protein
MAILFAGAESEDFTLSGGVISDTGGSRHRSAYARQAFYFTNNYATQSIRGSFAASSTVNLTGRFYINSVFSAGAPGPALTVGGSARLRVRVAGTGGGNLNTAAFVVETLTSGGVATTLATSTLTAPDTTLHKMDLLVSYGTSGRVRLYINNVLFCDYSGDVTASGATTLDGFIIGGLTASTSFGTAWSEIIVADEDTRPLSLKTIAPNATGDTTAWTSGTWADIDEIVATDADLAASDTALQVLSVNCTGMPSGASGLTVRAVKSVALAARGATGPTKLALGVRQSSTNAFASGVTLDTGYSVVSTTWTTNPVTSSAFTASEIDALQLAYRSET